MTTRQCIAAALCVLTSHQAVAMTEKEASGNLMYFAFAMKQGELCEKLGFPGMGTLRPWEKKNGEVLVKSMRRIEDFATASQKVTRDQATDVSLGLFVRHKETFDRELAPSMGKASCMRFGETLRLYETKLVKE
jgi:hypothetical protein